MTGITLKKIRISLLYKNHFWVYIITLKTTGGVVLHSVLILIFLLTSITFGQDCPENKISWLRRKVFE